jgi:ribosome-associated protein
MWQPGNQGNAMLEISNHLRISATEFQWTYVRSSGPGGQNVNKVASKAVLRWNVAASTSLPEDVKARFSAQQKHRITTLGELILSSQRFRDQERNRQDCLDRLREMLRHAALPPRPRRPTRPTRSSKEARHQAKRHRARTKSGRKIPAEE